jgi:hypothetical protein
MNVYTCIGTSDASVKKNVPTPKASSFGSKNVPGQSAFVTSSLNYSIKKNNNCIPDAYIYIYIYTYICTYTYIYTYI